MSRRVILLVEDDPMLQTLLIEILHTSNYYVLAAVTPNDVVRLTDRCRPNVAIVCGDSRGTFASGWRTAHELRVIDPSLPLVMLTTNNQLLREIGQTARGQWFAAGLLKPFRMDDLLTTVERVDRHRLAADV